MSPASNEARLDSKPSPDWFAVALFLVLACAISWPFFWWSRLHPDSYSAWQGIPDRFKGLPFMWGPGLAAIIVWGFGRWRGRSHQCVASLHGGSWRRALAFYGIPILALSAFHVETRSGDSYSGITMWGLGVLGFVQVLGEELGWRGWLNGALGGLRPWHRYLLIGLLWEFWHARVIIPGNPLSVVIPGQIFMLVVTVGLAFVIGWATDRTRSLAVAVTLHTWVNMPAELPGVGVAVVAGVSLPFWAWLIWTWPARTSVCAIEQPAPAKTSDT